MVASVTLFIFHRLDVCLGVLGTVVTKHHYNNKHFYQMRCLHGHSDLIVVGIARMFPVIINVLLYLLSIIVIWWCLSM